MGLRLGLIEDKRGMKHCGLVRSLVRVSVVGSVDNLGGSEELILRSRGSVGKMGLVPFLCGGHGVYYAMAATTDKASSKAITRKEPLLLQDALDCTYSGAVESWKPWHREILRHLRAENPGCKIMHHVREACDTSERFDHYREITVP